MTEKYKISFWQDENGYSEAQEYIWELKNKSAKSKDARIKLNKITEYIEMLENYGTEIGHPYVDHIECEAQLFELRPLRDRFFFFYKKRKQIRNSESLCKKDSKNSKERNRKSH